MASSFEKIKAGLEDSIAFEKDDKSRARIMTRESPISSKNSQFSKPKL